MDGTPLAADGEFAPEDAFARTSATRNSPTGLSNIIGVADGTLIYAAGSSAYQPNLGFGVEELVDTCMPTSTGANFLPPRTPPGHSTRSGHGFSNWRTTWTMWTPSACARRILRSDSNKSSRWEPQAMSSTIWFLMITNSTAFSKSLALHERSTSLFSARGACPARPAITSTAQNGRPGQPHSTTSSPTAIAWVPVLRIA